MSWKRNWDILFHPSWQPGGLDLIDFSVAGRTFENAESPATTGTLAAAWTGTNITATRETTVPLSGEGSLKVVVAGGAGSVYKAFDRAKFGYPFPGHNNIRARYIRFRGTCDSGTETIRVTFGDVSDADHYRYWSVQVAQSKYRTITVDLNPDNTEGFSAPTPGLTTWDPEQIDRLGFTNLTNGRTFYFDDIEIYYEYSLQDLIGFPTEAPVDMGDVGSLHARINGLWANVKALEGKTDQYSRRGPSELEVGQSATWALELNSDFAPPTETEIVPGNYTIYRVRHGTSTEIVASTTASELDGVIYKDYQPQEDNWLEGDLLKVTFSGGYVRTDEEPTETLASSGVSGENHVHVDNAYQWQVGWLVRVYDDVNPTEWMTVSAITDPTTVTFTGNLANNHVTNAGMTRSIKQDLSTAIFFTRISREPTAEEFNKNFVIADYDLGDASTSDTERWSEEVVEGVIEGSVADINTTVGGKIYILADPTTPLATGYGYRKIDFCDSKYFTAIVDDTITWGTLGASSSYSRIIVTKGIAYDSQNFVAVGREKSSGVNRYWTDAFFATVQKGPAVSNTTDDAIAFKVQRLNDIWRVYYSSTQFPDYEWVLLKEYEDSGIAMSERTSVILESYSAGTGFDETVRSDFDNFLFELGAGFLQQMYEQPTIVPIVEQQSDPRVDQNTVTGIETFRVGLIDASNGLPVTSEITPGTTLVDRFREVTDTDWTNQAGETITNAEADGYIYALYDFPNAIWQPGDQARFRLQNVSVTNTETGRVFVVPSIAIYMVVGGPPNAGYGGNLWLGDVIGNKADAVIPIVSTTASSAAYLKALIARGIVMIRAKVTTGTSPTNVASTDLIGFGDNFFNNQFYMQVIQAGGAVPEPKVRKITDYTSNTGLFIVDTFTDNVDVGDDILIIHESLIVIGRNDTDNVFDSSSVAFNENGSMLERLEFISKIFSNSTVYTSSAATVTSITAAALADVVSQYVGQVVIPLEGAMAGEGRFITAYNGTDTLTVSPAWASDPDAGGNIKFIVLSTGLGIIPTALGTDGTTVTDSAVTVLGAIGADNVNNVFASTNVVANSDGSVLERLEHILVALGGTTGVTTALGTTLTAIDTVRTEANDYWNGGVFVCIDGTNKGLARPISDFVNVGATLYFEPAFPNAVALGVNYIILTRYDVARIIGDNNTDNAYSSSSVVTNEDGSVLERLEQLQEAINRGTGSSVPANKSLYDIIGVTYVDGGGVFNTDSVWDDIRTIGQYLIDGTAGAEAGTAMPAGKSIRDVIGTGYADAGPGNPDVENIREHLQAYIGKGTGTVLAANKSLVDALGSDGVTVTDSTVTVLGAIGANSANNSFDSSLVVSNENGSSLERLEDLKNGPVGLLNVYNIVSSLMLTGSVSGSVTAPDIVGTEIEVFSLVPGTTAKPLIAKLDMDSMQAGDTTILRVYYRFSNGGSWVQDDYVSFAGADAGLLNSNKIVSNRFDANPFGVRLTLAMSAGVARSYNWFAVYDA